MPSAECRRSWLQSSIQAATPARAAALSGNCSMRRSSNSTVECHDSMTALSSAEPGRPIDWQRWRLRYRGPMNPGPGPLALVGSGEYLAVMAGVEGALIEGRPSRYIQIPTAAAPEGADRLQYWLDLGAAQAERLGVEQVPVVVRDRDEAGSADLAT